MVREAGLEPARPEWTLEPESSESANSTTRAFLKCSAIIARELFFVKVFVWRKKNLSGWESIDERDLKRYNFYHIFQRNRVHRYEHLTML